MIEPTPSGMGEGFSLARRGANGLMKINLRQDFMTSAVLVMAGPIELFLDNRQLTLWSSCSTTIALSWASHSANRVDTTEHWTVLTLRTLLSWMWMTSPLWDEKRARHSRPAPWLTHQV